MMNKSELQLKFRQIRQIHTTTIMVIVLLLMAVVFYTYTYGPLYNFKMDNDLLLILIAAIINLVIVFVSVGIKKKKIRNMNTAAPMHEKLEVFRFAQLRQLFLTATFVLLNAIGFLITGNKILFLLSFVMLIYLLSLNPTTEKFIRGASLTKDEKRIFLH